MSFGFSTLCNFNTVTPYDDGEVQPAPDWNTTTRL